MLFKETFSHHPSFLFSMSRFYESFPLRTTAPNLVAHIPSSLPFIIELSSSSSFGLFGFIQPPTAFSSSPSPSKTALKKAVRKGKQRKQRDQHSALLAYMAEQGITVPLHLAAGTLTISKAPSATPQRQGTVIATSMAEPPAMDGRQVSERVPHAAFSIGSLHLHHPTRIRAKPGTR
jgi:hypothetical protein